MIKDIEPGKVSLELDIVEIKQARNFSKFGKPGVVVDIVVKDKTGEMTLVLFEEPKISVGQRIKLNGFAKEYLGNLQLYVGKGSIEVIQNI